jgi:hypothetical protein
MRKTNLFWNSLAIIDTLIWFAMMKALNVPNTWLIIICGICFLIFMFGSCMARIAK